MGQKVHPKSVRLGFIQDWQSRWFAPKNMPAFIMEDSQIRALINKRFKTAAVSSVGIERAGSFLRVNIHTARPGVIIGKKGVDIEKLRKDLEKFSGNKTFINVIEIKNPESDANLVAQAIAMQIEKRAHYAMVMKKSIDRAMAARALGIKIMVSGRLGGAEIARSEWKKEGRIPLHTLCADIDYGFFEANTISGKIGIKVWIYKKKHFAKSPKEILNKLRKEREMVGSLSGKPAESKKPVEPTVSVKESVVVTEKKAEAKKVVKKPATKKVAEKKASAVKKAVVKKAEPKAEKKAPAKKTAVKKTVAKKDTKDK